MAGRLKIRKSRNTCDFVTLTALWVFSSKNTATAMQQRTQTRHPQQNLSCPKAWLPNYQGIGTRSHPPHLTQKRLLVAHSLQLVRFFPLPNDVREINSGAVWLTPWHFLFCTNVAMDFSKKSIETILPHALSRQLGGTAKQLSGGPKSLS